MRRLFVERARVRNSKQFKNKNNDKLQKDGKPELGFVIVGVPKALSSWAM